MCGDYRSFRLRGDQPCGFALLGDRWPSFQRFLSCLAHPREEIRAGRQKPDVCRCAAFIKKGTHLVIHRQHWNFVGTCPHVRLPEFFVHSQLLVGFLIIRFREELVSRNKLALFFMFPSGN